MPTLDGNLDDWTADTRLDTPATGAEGFAIYGDLVGDTYFFAISSSVPIGPNTTIWLDTDLNRATGFQVFGGTTGADYNINIAGDGTLALYTGAAGETAVATSLTYAYNGAGTIIEIAIPKSDFSTVPSALRLYADVNDTVLLPNSTASYANTNFFVSAHAVTTGPEMRVAIVYSETSANAFYDLTNYGQLFMSAQNQAMQAGIPFDVLSEADLTNVDNLIGYDAIIFPSFSHVNSADLSAITAALTIASQNYGVGLIAAGNFMTNDETGAALPATYALMNALLGVGYNAGFGSTDGVQLVATNAANPVLDTYAAGEVVGDYSNTGYQYFFDTTGTGEVLFSQNVTGANAGTYDAVIATTTSARNVHFASEALLGNNNILGEVIDWVVSGNEIDVSLAMTRGTSLFFSRTDMDQSQVSGEILSPGIYDAMLPIIENWYNTYGFVGSYYINIGADAPGVGNDYTDWAVSGPFYEQLLALEGEIGTHSWTHPDDTNLLVADTPAISAALAKLDPQTLDLSVLDDTEKALLLTSFTFQFEYSKRKIEQELGIITTGTAVPGAPEKLDASQQIIQFFDYMSGGYSATGAGFPGGFGFLTPALDDKVYLAPNMSFDFTLVGFQMLTAEQASAVWAAEYAEILSHATTPIIAFPWHDYGVTNSLNDPNQIYTQAMFETIIAQAAADGTEFVTGEELASRIESFSNSTLSVARNGNVMTATVGSSDAGSFALTVGDANTVISSVANWYAYNGNQVFLPSLGGTFEITTGLPVADVTHITGLPTRADLLSLTGDGGDLGFTFNGKGNVTVDLRAQSGESIVITGADGVTLVDDHVTLAFDAVADHTVIVDYSTGTALVGTSGGDIILGGNASETITGNAGNDIIGGGGGQDSIQGGAGNDVISDSGGASVSGGSGNDQVISLTNDSTLTDEQDAGVSATSLAVNDVYVGGIGADTIRGFNGNDILIGDASKNFGGNDVIDGGIGLDLLEGRGGADVFIFRENDSQVDDGTGTLVIMGGGDVIGAFDFGTGFGASVMDITAVTPVGADFQVGLDKVQLIGFTNAADIQSNLGSYLTEVAGNAVFEDSGTRITFFGVTVAELSIDDFTFI